MTEATQPPRRAGPAAGPAGWLKQDDSVPDTEKEAGRLALATGRLSRGRKGGVDKHSRSMNEGRRASCDHKESLLSTICPKL